MSAAEAVGIIGLGNMGGAIAQRLIEQGTRLHVHDTDKGNAGRLAAMGAVVHANARSVADEMEIVLVCLPTIDACLACALDPHRGLRGGKRIRHYVEMSTVGPAAMRNLADQLSAGGIAAIDSPVSGGAAGALAGTLAIMVSSPASERNAVWPVLTRISPQLFVIGDTPGQAQTMKLINNLLAAANMATSFEALALGVKLGLPAEKIIEVANASSGRNTGMDERKTRAILERRFSGLGKIALLEKDIALALQVAQQAGVDPDALLAMSGMARLWERAAQEGLNEQDVSALVQVVERSVGVTVAASNS